MRVQNPGSPIYYTNRTVQRDVCVRSVISHNKTDGDNFLGRPSFDCLGRAQCEVVIDKEIQPDLRSKE
jgi:hypothetical protein